MRFYSNQYLLIHHLPLCKGILSASSLWSSTMPSAMPQIADSKLCDGGMLGFFHTLERLKTNKRTGWVNHQVPKPESIADHMYRMAMMAMVIPESEGPPLDIAKCVMMSLVHDLAEADVGDITPPHASGISREEKLRMEKEAMERIAGLLGHPSIQSLRVLSLWDEYEARETPEAKFVKDLDLFELATQGFEYENAAGVKTLHEFFSTTVPRILHPTVKEWAHELMEQRRVAWSERGWENYIHVDVTTPEHTTIVAPRGNGQPAENGMSTLNVDEKTKRLPVRVWGGHSNALADSTNVSGDETS